MAVQWDAVLAREVARELDTSLRGTRLRAFAFEPKQRRATFFTDAGCLEWRLHPNEGQVRLYPQAEPFETAIALSAKIRSITAPADERRIVVHIQRMRGQDRQSLFHILLASNRRNAIWVNALNVIQKVLLSRPSDQDPLVVGRPFVSPPSSDRSGAAGVLDRAEWDTLTTDEHFAPLRQVAWLSPLNARAVLDSDDPYDRWCALAGATPAEPGVLSLPKGAQPYPVALPGVDRTATDSLLDAFASSAEAPATPLDPEVETLLGHARSRAERRVQALRRELDGTEDPLVVRGWADLILTRLTSVPRGAPEAELEGFDGSTTLVPLDPSLTPRENAEALYDRAGRAERARQSLPQRITEAEQRVDELSAALEGLGRGEPPDSSMIGHLRETSRSPSESGGPSLPYRVYQSTGGLDIWVGRGSKSNDALTFQHARPNDVWLHARDAAGAHVVLRWPADATPPAQDLEDAAVLAALHSKARHSGWVPVDWTRRKHVRKPRKAAAGAVVPSRVKTVFVEPNEERADAMAVRE